MPGGSLRAFCYCHKMGGNVAGCQHPKRAFFDGSWGSQQQNIFVNQRKINSESLFLRYGVILGCWKVPKRVQKLYTILSPIFTKPYFTRVTVIAQPLKMRHVTRHVSVTLASRFLCMYEVHVSLFLVFFYSFSLFLVVFNTYRGASNYQPLVFF